MKPSSVGVAICVLLASCSSATAPTEVETGDAFSAGRHLRDVVAAAAPPPDPSLHLELLSGHAVARGIAKLLAGGDVAIAGQHVRAARARTICGIRTRLTFAAEGTESLENLRATRDALVAGFREDLMVTEIGTDLRAVTVPFPLRHETTGELYDAAWVSVVVAMSCAPELRRR